MKHTASSGMHQPAFKTPSSNKKYTAMENYEHSARAGSKPPLAKQKECEPAPVEVIPRDPDAKIPFYERRTVDDGVYTLDILQGATRATKQDQVLSDQTWNSVIIQSEKLLKLCTSELSYSLASKIKSFVMQRVESITIRNIDFTGVSKDKDAAAIRNIITAILFGSGRSICSFTA